MRLFFTPQIMQILRNVNTFFSLILLYGIKRFLVTFGPAKKGVNENWFKFKSIMYYEGQCFFFPSSYDCPCSCIWYTVCVQNIQSGLQNHSILCQKMLD